MSSSAKNPGKLWCKVNVCGQNYEVRLVDKEDTKDIDGCEGLTIHTKNMIYIKDNLASDRQDDTFIHEVFVHALLEASGASHVLREHLKISEEQWEHFEELLARLYSPALLSLLRTSNLIKLPEKPESVVREIGLKQKAAKRKKNK